MDKIFDKCMEKFACKDDKPEKPKVGLTCNSETKPVVTEVKPCKPTPSVVTCDDKKSKTSATLKEKLFSNTTAAHKCPINPAYSTKLVACREKGGVARWLWPVSGFFLGYYLGRGSVSYEPKQEVKPQPKPQLAVKLTLPEPVPISTHCDDDKVMIYSNWCETPITDTVRIYR